MQASKKVKKGNKEFLFKENNLYLEEGDVFHLMKFMTFGNRRVFISWNKLLHYIAQDNNKLLVFNEENKNTLMKLIKKIRSLN